MKSCSQHSALSHSCGIGNTRVSLERLDDLLIVKSVLEGLYQAQEDVELARRLQDRLHTADLVWYVDAESVQTGGANVVQEFKMGFTFLLVARCHDWHFRIVDQLGQLSVELLGPLVLEYRVDVLEEYEFLSFLQLRSLLGVLIHLVLIPSICNVKPEDFLRKILGRLLILLNRGVLRALGHLSHQVLRPMLRPTHLLNVEAQLLPEKLAKHVIHVLCIVYFVANEDQDLARRLLLPFGGEVVVELHKELLDCQLLRQELFVALVNQEVEVRLGEQVVPGKIILGLDLR